jgi:hypothetical protein
MNGQPGLRKIVVRLDRCESMLDDFMALSRVLTGVEDLDVNLGRQYLDRLASSPFQPQLDEILERFRGLEKGEKHVEQVKAKIVEVDLLRPTVCQIILLWYTSTVQDNLGMDPPAPSLSFRYGTPEEYFSGLAWKIIGAHPPGLSGGYFGHWRYRPDNEPK